MQSQASMVLTFTKVTSRLGLRGLLAHNLRIEKPKNADPYREGLNIYGCGRGSGRTVSGLMGRLQGNLKGHKPRKNAVHAHEYVISGSHQHMKGMGRSECIKYFNDTIKFFREMYGKESMLIPCVHFDERTPHLHLIVQPMKDGKLNGKAFTGGHKNVLAKLRKDLHQQVASKYGLSRGVPREKATHRDLSEYYKIVNNTLPEARRKITELEQRIILEQAEAQKAREELGKVKQQLRDLQGHRELLEGDLAKLSKVREQAEAMTREQLEVAIKKIDENNYRPSFRMRH